MTATRSLPARLPARTWQSVVLPGPPLRLAMVSTVITATLRRYVLAYCPVSPLALLNFAKPYPGAFPILRHEDHATIL